MNSIKKSFASLTRLEMPVNDENVMLEFDASINFMGDYREFTCQAVWTNAGYILDIKLDGEYFGDPVNIVFDAGKLAIPFNYLIREIRRVEGERGYKRKKKEQSGGKYHVQ